MKTNTVRLVLLASLIAPILPGCSVGRSAYYSAESAIGRQKRDIFVSRVKATRDDQELAKQQFKTTLERFQDVTSFKGGELEAKYKKLNTSYNQCQDRANAVTKRIKSVEQVASDMFKEWADENGQISNADLRRENEKKLDASKDRYRELLALMHKSEARMQPVLRTFNDTVLTLKHDLNAAAVASLQGTAVGIDADVTALIKDMDASIAEADAFVKQMK